MDVKNTKVISSIAVACIVLLLSSGMPSYAQGLWAYSINGNVKVYSDSWKDLSPLQELDLSDSLCFSKYASVTILDRGRGLLYALQAENVCDVGTLISAAMKRVKKQQGGFISYLWNSLRGNNNAEAHRLSAGVVYRDRNINAAIAHRMSMDASSYDIDFIMVDAVSGEFLGKSVCMQQPFYFVVRNRSDLDLFVDIIDKDSSGSYSDCFPVDDLQQLLQLFIPARSEVMLDTFPCVFTGPVGVDELTLIASHQPFDPNSVVNALSDGNTIESSISVGIFKTSLSVE